MEEVERSDPSECQREAESAWKGYWAQTRVRKTRSQAISAESSSSSRVHGPSCPKSQSRILPGPFLLPSTSHPLSWDKGKGVWKRRILSSRVILLRNWVSLKGALKMIALEWTEPLFLPHYIQSPKVVGIQVYIRARFKKQNGSHTKMSCEQILWSCCGVLCPQIWPFYFHLVAVAVQSLTHVQLFATPWTAAHQASMLFTISQSLLKFMSIESVMPSNHLILRHPLLLLTSIFPSTRVFSNESALHIRWPKYWSFSISPSNEYSVLISFHLVHATRHIDLF